MLFFADLHIHSPYSRATSKALHLQNLYWYGKLKGLSIIGTGDCTHPIWRSIIAEQLTEDGDGLLSLKKGCLPTEALWNKPNTSKDMRFMLTGEISTIYKWNNKTRKVHHVVCLPSLRANEQFSKKLATIGNIHSDGRPILGIDSRNLLEILLEVSPDAVLIPAHIWTPWFSVLGSKSGFDSIDECYRDLSSHIFSVETGLSSDPPMNRRVSQLDRFTLVSNSDAHSPGNLGREANIFSCDQGYNPIMKALRTGSGFDGTLEFFPEEGKYHHDGHRACNICFSPQESISHKGICPVCRSPLTLGVAYRVEQLADRAMGTNSPRGQTFRHVYALDSTIAQIVGVGVASKKVQKEYFRLINLLGSELYILLSAPLASIAAASTDTLAFAIDRMRKGIVSTSPGYDGEYGSISLLP